MRNLFAVNQTDPKHVYYAGQEFIALRTSEQDQKRLKKLQDQQKDFEKRIKDSPLERAIKPVGFFFVIAVLYALVLWASNMAKGTLQEVRTKLLYACAIAVVLLICWLIIGIRNNKRKRELENSDEKKSLEKGMNKISRDIAENMQTDMQAVNVDTLLYAYTMEGAVLKKTAAFENCYANFPFVAQLDRQRQQLILSDAQYKFAIPFTCIERIEQVKGKVNMNKWNKPESYLAKPYSSWHVLKTARKGRTVYRIGSVYRLLVKGKNETFEILFPAYEEAFIERLQAAAFSGTPQRISGNGN